MIHVEGMGWLGSVIALNLADRDIPFTWHDADAAHVAWKACTGIVYPAGDDRSVADHAAWLSWAAAPWLPSDAVEICSYWFNHRNPPHGGRYKLGADLGWARMAAVPAVQVDVPTIVADARASFAGCRATAPPAGRHTLIRAHGFSDRLAGYVWGWSTLVELAYPGDLAEASTGGRPTFYGREGRFKMAYAYALPGRPTSWLAGSSLITQKQAKPLDAGKHFRSWQATFGRLMPEVDVINVGPTVQGWRPKPGPDDDGRVSVAAGEHGLVITVPPLWHSGVRWAPSVVAEVLGALA